MVLPTMMASPKATPKTFSRPEGFLSDMRAELTIYAWNMTSLLPFILACSLQQGPDSIVARAAKVIAPLTDSRIARTATTIGESPVLVG